MEYLEKLEVSIKEKIEIRVAKLEAEIKVLRKSQQADEAYYGLGGPYMRRERAMDKRRKEISGLTEFLKQMHLKVIANPVIYFSIYCTNCRKNILSEGYIAEGWHECPVCRKMIYGGGVKLEMLVMEEK